MPPASPLARFEPKWNSPIRAKTRFFNILGGGLRIECTVRLASVRDVFRISAAILRWGREVLMISAAQCSVTA
jgi:hypothetical protein